MTWQLSWSLILGFTLSAIIEALVRKSTIAGLLPNDRSKGLATATVLGALLVGAAFSAVVSISPGASNSSTPGGSS